MTDLWVSEHVPEPALAGDGNGGRPMVVLVHGSMDRSAAFARVVGDLPDLHTIRYDRRGYGRSVGLGVVDVAGHVDDCIEVIDGRASVVVGHSLGGVIALAAAERRPDLIGAVGAFEAPMPWVDWWPSRSAGGEAMLAGDGMTAEAAGDAAERFMRRMVGDERWEALGAGVRHDRRAEGPALLAELRALRAGPAYDPARLHVPIVVGTGTESREHHQWAAGELARLAGTDDVIAIEGAGHGAHVSHHQEFAALVRLVVERAAEAQRSQANGSLGTSTS
jgi:pimeloyl-ACP methyl ester carboxylesterase